MAKVNRAHLRLLIDQDGRSMRAISLDAGLGETGVKDIVNGKSQDPKGSTIAALAKTLQVSMDQLLEEGAEALEAAHLEVRAKGRGRDTTYPVPAMLPVRGSVQAGAWMELDDLDQREPVMVAAPAHPAVPTQAQWLSRVRGDSMNALTKDGVAAGIIDGDLVMVVDAIAINYQPRTGDVVEAERSRFDGREREITLKQVEVTPDGRVQLWPRSTNPRWREPLELDPANGDQVVVRIRGKVLTVLRQL